MKRFLTISACILLIAISASAQANRSAASTENLVKQVRFYPNPASSFINFEFKDITDLPSYSFKVFNFIGKKVLEINSLSPRTVINLNDYFRGVYIFQLTDRTGKIVESGKFQVVK